LVHEPAPELPHHHFDRDSDWYKDAIIYEVHVRAFQDSNGDGIGDFPGLTSRLDYIRDLGVTAIWLLPFFESPLRDDGYDVADYRTINPSYGTMDDFCHFLGEAHSRGLRVICDLVLNHTSDQHPWFQRARSAPLGHPWRDYYVWSNTGSEYHGTRVIFQDFEASNWTWDPVAGQYFWHRFYHHQPDLNYENPEVQREMIEVADFWLRLGIDGFRLDAVPYLFEAEGTTCADLPETHAFLRELRAHIDEEFTGRALLAEANGWPEDTARYFGHGDECQLAFDFPLMPRLFLAVSSEDITPILEILRRTPGIPESGSWALFLRNHDELTLEMVTEEERLAMWAAYAPEERARINLGIKRRLGPLLKHNQQLMRMMFSLLFSFEGTPVIYYGDEIGMGDDLSLDDRDSVRTPMQWDATTNAGFSSADPDELYLPLVSNPSFSYHSVNVKAQDNDDSQLLSWLRWAINHRQASPALRRGKFHLLDSSNRAVLTFLRESPEERCLVLANFAASEQEVEIRPLLGEAAPVVLGPHEFRWVSLGPQPPGATPHPETDRR
jgi:maltose alpha-D-glucosyltransferase/alpha-amylase